LHDYSSFPSELGVICAFAGVVLFPIPYAEFQPKILNIFSRFRSQKSLTVISRDAKTGDEIFFQPFADRRAHGKVGFGGWRAASASSGF
jgi:hypothetical protein